MKQLHFGVDYYPEHWERARWDKDAALMQGMGIRMVRMAEFSWHKLEPEEGIYEFGWLDEAIGLFGAHGIYTIVGTPTAAPPAWMADKHPEILPIDREGRVRGFGGRHHDCQSSPVYRQYVRKLTEEMARRYGENPYVIGWQPDNELGNSHQELCTCASCRKHFQGWLRKKYQTVQNLNQAWGNAFWSQEYNDFKEVPAPRITVTGENPSAMLDWKRFCSDLIVDFAREQTEIIRRYAKNQFITHNYMGFADKVDYYKLGELLDFVSHDQYPGGFYLPESPHEKEHVLAATLDVVRSYKNQPFWIMEQQSGITGWEVMGRAPAPGQLSAWAMQSIAHGADAVVFFRWRTCAMGTEQYWHGILPHSGNPGRRYKELQDFIHEVNPLMDSLQGSMPNAQVGIVFSFEQEYAFQIQPHHKDLSYTRQLQKYYHALYERNIPVDFVPQQGDFSKYKLLLAPLQYLMSPELEEKYMDYVGQGGHLLLTMRTGVKDVNNICMTERELPGRLSKVAGVEVLDYDCLRDAQIEVLFGEEKLPAGIWSDLMRLLPGTETLASYASEFYAGEPCITAHAYGCGACYYVGTEPGEALMDRLLSLACSRAEVDSLMEPVDGVECASRENESQSFLFVINHTGECKAYEAPEGYQLLKGGQAGALKAYEAQILQRQKMP
ncbi:MAG: beta-galactosidase [Lachnospiraceae bacterium]|nr:beta-galactosidase [Lachnospiraceae bacterium]